MVLLTRAGECDSTDPARPLNFCSTSRPPPHRPRRAWTGGILAITKSIRARFRACCVNSSVPCRVRSASITHEECERSRHYAMSKRVWADVDDGQGWL